jgi:hypothetical protein
MATAQISFSINFVPDKDQSIIFSPIFYNWRPSKRQALTLKTPDKGAVLKVWFSNAISYERFAQGMTIVSNIKGILQIDSIEKDIEEIFEQNKTHYSPYEAFGKRVVKKIFNPTLSRLFNILKINYGQYWIPDFLDWDSRSMFLGQYCSKLGMQWSMDGKRWLDFYPTRGVMGVGKFRIVGDDFSQQFISKEDWKTIRKLIDENYQPSLAAVLLRRAHVCFKLGDFRMSFIEGISSLELSIKDFLSSRIKQVETFSKTMDEFFQIGLRGQLVAVGLSHGTIPHIDIENAVKAIEVRNMIVHKGLNPSSAQSKVFLKGLFRTVSYLLDDPELKFPEITL